MPAALVENSQVICEVWASNLEEEMRKIREIVLTYSYIAMVRSAPAFDPPPSLSSGSIYCGILKGSVIPLTLLVIKPDGRSYGFYAVSSWPVALRRINLW